MAGGWIFTLGKRNSVGGFAWRRRFMIHAYQRKEIRQLHTGREINRCKERSALLEVTYRRHGALYDTSVVMWLPVIWMILIFLKVKARHPAVSHWITFVLFFLGLSYFAHPDSGWAKFAWIQSSCSTDLPPERVAGVANLWQFLCHLCPCC